MHVHVSHLSEALVMERVLQRGGRPILYLLLSIGLAWSQLQQDYIGREISCPDENAHEMVIEVPWGVPGRAYKTLPSGLVIAPSKIKGAGFGVLSETFIPKFTWLGEYEGEIVSWNQRRNASLYTWVIHRKGQITACIDAFHFHLSSYHRYINAPLTYRDENVVPMECFGRIYYLTSKDVPPGAELLVYYGHSYAKRLHVDLNDYYAVPLELRSAGVDLNKRQHQRSIETAGAKLQDVRFLPQSWFSKVLKYNENKKKK